MKLPRLVDWIETLLGLSFFPQQRPPSPTRGKLRRIGLENLEQRQMLTGVLYWDGGASGTWNSTNTNWSPQSSGGSNVVWSDGAAAVFDGADGSVSVESGVSASSIQISSGSHIFTDNSVTVSGSVQVNAGGLTANSIVASSLIIGGAVGSPATVTIDSQPVPLAPTLSSINSTFGLTGDGDSILTLTGTNFTAASVVKFAGASLATTYGSPTSLTAVIPASALMTAGAFAVTVADGLNSSTDSQTFTVMALPAPSYSTPLDNPTLPTGMDVFNPVVSAVAPGPADPAVAKITSQAGPGNTAAIAGDQFASDLQVTLFGQTANGNATQMRATQLELTGNSAAIAIPNTMPANSMYFAWPSTSQGVGRSIAINKTEAWYVKSSSTGNTNGFVGDTVTVVGQNLSGPGGESWVYLQPGGGSGQWLNTTDVNPYRVQFTLPNNLASVGTSTTSNSMALGSETFTTQAGLGYVAGMDIRFWSHDINFSYYMSGTVTSYSGTTLVVKITSLNSLNGSTSTVTGTGAQWSISPGYQVWLHNGHGGIYGWSQCPELLWVADETALTINYDFKTYNMPPPSGGDDIPAFATALTALSGGPGKIVLQAGNYQLNSELNLGLGSGYGVYLKGAGVGSTSITVNGTWSTAHGTRFINASSLCKVTDLTIDISGVSTTSQIGIACYGGRDWENVDIIAKVDYCVSLYATDNSMVIRNVTITGSGIFSPGSHGSTTYLIEGCTFYVGWDNEAPIYIWGASDLYINNCYVQDYDKSSAVTRGRGRIASLTAPAYQVYIGGCIGNSLYPFAGKGEMILLDNGTYYTNDQVTSAANVNGVTTITLATMKFDYSGYQIGITAGTGLGQVGKVISTDYGSGGTTITLDRLWNVLPDATSLCNVGTVTDRVAIYDNVESGDPTGNDAVVHWNAGTAVSLQGASEVFYDSNTVDNMARMSDGGTGHYNASSASNFQFFTIEQNNVATNLVYEGVRVVSGSTVNSGETCPLFGNVYRNNNLSGAMHMPTSAIFDLDVWEQFGSTNQMTIWETSSGQDAPHGVWQDPGNTNPFAAGTYIVYDSTFSLGNATFSGSQGIEAPELTIINVGSVFNNYESSNVAGPGSKSPQIRPLMPASGVGGFDASGLQPVSDWAVPSTGLTPASALVALGHNGQLATDESRHRQLARDESRHRRHTNRGRIGESPSAEMAKFDLGDPAGEIDCI